MRKKQTFSLLAIVVLLMQTIFGSLSATATTSDSSLQITMTTNGQPYVAGESTTTPVEVRVTTTSGDSANVEFSQDLGATWRPFDVAQPHVVVDVGVHELWFRLAGMSELKEYSIHIIQSAPQARATGSVLYVKAGATGNGTSWASAFGSLQAALDIVQPKQQIWLAAGEYKPEKRVGGSDPSDYRNTTFQLKNNVAIYGGFNGTENDLAERNWTTNKTTLSGNIGDPNDNKDNAFRVFYHPDGLKLDNTAILDGVTITGGYGSSYGGGMYNFESSPTLENVTFDGNEANNGGGLYNDKNSKPILKNVTFIANGNEKTYGGGIFNNRSSNPTLENVSFTSNKAIYGGGMYNSGVDSSSTLTNVTFANHKVSDGGGMYNYDSSPTLTNVTFIGNEAGTGGGMYNTSVSKPILTNITMTGNKSTSYKGAIYGGVGSIQNSIIVGNSDEPALYNGNWTIENSLLDIKESGNVVAKYHKTKTDIEAGTYRTEDVFIDPSQQNYQLRVGSPAINRGNNVLNTTPTDLAGNPRIQNGTIDLGAYEALPYLVTTPNIDIQPTDKTVNVGDDAELGITASGGTTLSYQWYSNKTNSISGGVPVTGATNAAYKAPTNIAGSTYYYCIVTNTDVTGNPAVSVTSKVVKVQVNNAIIYVKAGATGNGSSWASAFGSLQAALDAVQPKQQIWLAEGEYKPEKKFGGSDPSDYRNTTFQLKNNVAIYGGFNGTEKDLAERNWITNITTLSGNIEDPKGNKGNAFRVFYHPDGLKLDNTAILDGVTITGGFGSSYGGGMYNSESSPTLENVTFTGNEAGNGGGLYNDKNSKPILKNVTFTANGNKATYGGGMYNNRSSSPTLENVTFTGNEAIYGGGMYNSGVGSSPTLKNVTFANHKVSTGGGMYNNGDNSPTLTNVSFIGNEAKTGGGMYNSNDSKPILTNITMTGNKSTSYKGAIYDGKGSIQNSIILGNSDEPALYNGNWSIENSLLDVKESGNVVAKFHKTKTDIEASTYRPEDVFIDPSQQNYQLRAGSPAIDKGNNAHNTTLTDLTGNPRIQNGTIDLGVYEALPYKVTYFDNDATGGTVPIDKKTYAQGHTVTVRDNSGNLVKTGYTFDSWNTKDDGQGTRYTANSTLQISSRDVVLYAVWKAIPTPNPTYTVTYNANGATSGAVPQDNTTYAENTTVTVQGNSGNLGRTGYTFKGWNTKIDGKGTSYAANTTFQMGKAKVTLYAEWTANPPTTGGGAISPPPSDDSDTSSSTVKIVLRTNGGTILETIEISYNTKVNDLPVPMRAGYRFDGWYRDAALTKQWTGDTNVRENIELYAKWTALPVEEPEMPQEPQQPKPTVVTFDDIENHWAQQMIEKLATEGIIQGYEDGTFRPNESISRMHVAVLLTRAFSLERVRVMDGFTDVLPTHPYYEAITTLQQAGIVDGTNGAFYPTKKMTRAQLAKVLVGVLGLTPEGISSFADVDHTHWSTSYIAVLEREGIALGDNGNFRPNEPVTRAQFVAFLYRIMEN